MGRDVESDGGEAVNLLLGKGDFSGQEWKSHRRRGCLWRAWAVFLPRARDFGDVVARAGKTPVQLRHQIVALWYEHREILPTGGKL
jgi:hypothetical protein